MRCCRNAHSIRFAVPCSEQQYAQTADGDRPAAMNADHSLTDTLPRLASDDDDDTSLLVDTDQIDFGKFREDGSFIGQYNTRR